MESLASVCTQEICDRLESPNNPLLNVLSYFSAFVTCLLPLLVSIRCHVLSYFPYFAKCMPLSLAEAPPCFQENNKTSRKSRHLARASAFATVQRSALMLPSLRLLPSIAMDSFIALLAATILLVAVFLLA